MVRCWCGAGNARYQAVGIAPLSINLKPRIWRGFKFIRRGRDLATSRLTDVRRSRPRLAMLADTAYTQTRIKLRLSNPDATQSSLRGSTLGICLPVKFLTEFSCRPGSRYSPLPSGKTRTSLRLSNPDAIPSSWYRSTLHKFKTPH